MHVHIFKTPCGVWRATGARSWGTQYPEVWSNLPNSSNMPMAQVYVSSEWPELYESFASDDFGPVKPPNLHSNPCIYVYVCAYIHISIYLSDDFGPVTLSPPTPDPHTLNLNLNPNLSTPNPEP